MHGNSKVVASSSDKVYSRRLQAGKHFYMGQSVRVTLSAKSGRKRTSELLKIGTS